MNNRTVGNSVIGELQRIHCHQCLSVCDNRTPLVTTVTKESDALFRLEHAARVAKLKDRRSASTGLRSILSNKC